MSYKTLFAILVVFLALPVLSRADVTGSYFAVVVRDIEISSDWYEQVLGLVEQSRLTEENRYDIVNLAGRGLAVELLALADAVDRPPGRLEGPFKLGFLVDNIRLFVADLPDSISAPEIIFDETNGLLLIQLRDPDENIIQVMQLLNPGESVKR